MCTIYRQIGAMSTIFFFFGVQFFFLNGPVETDKRKSVASLVIYKWNPGRLADTTKPLIGGQQVRYIDVLRKCDGDAFPPTKCYELPCLSVTVVSRSNTFSSLRCLKTLLKSTTSETRFTGFALISTVVWIRQTGRPPPGLRDYSRSVAFSTRLHSIYHL